MRNNVVLLGCAVWICMVGSCLSLKYVVQKGNLEVIGPESLKGFYESSTGRFGIPEYGGSLAGIVVYPKVNQKGCGSFGRYYISFKIRPGGLPIIVLVDRGDCFFTSKVYNAQKAGAAAVLIVDSVDEPLMAMETPEENFGNNDFVSKINIPSAFISKSLGDSIKEALSRGELVDISLLFNSPGQFALPPNEQVKYEIWISANLGCGIKCDEQLEFLKNFREVARMFEERGYTQFTPHHITWYCPQAFILTKQCKSQCLFHGRYCAPKPREGGSYSWGNEGKDIVYQTIVQSCFYKLAKENGTPWLWWDYVFEFASQCTMLNNKFAMQSCRDQIIGRLGFDLKKVYECIGDIEADMEHPLLAAEQKTQVDVTILPTLVIKNNHYSGKLVKEEVVKAICAEIREQVRPDICPKEDITKTKNIVVLKNDQSKQEYYKEFGHLSSEESNFEEGVHKQGGSYKEFKAMASSTTSSGERWVKDKAEETKPAWSWSPSNSITSSARDGWVVEAIKSKHAGSSIPSREAPPPQATKMDMDERNDDLEVEELALVISTDDEAK